jgi:hypothetical protein
VFCMYPLDVTIADVEIEPWIAEGRISTAIITNAVAVNILFFDVFYFPNNV